MGGKRYGMSVIYWVDGKCVKEFGTMGWWQILWKEFNTVVGWQLLLDEFDTVVWMASVLERV